MCAQPEQSIEHQVKLRNKLIGNKIVGRPTSNLSPLCADMACRQLNHVGGQQAARHLEICMLCVLHDQR